MKTRSDLCLTLRGLFVLPMFLISANRHENHRKKSALAVLYKDEILNFGLCRIASTLFESEILECFNFPSIPVTLWKNS